NHGSHFETHKTAFEDGAVTRDDLSEDKAPAAERSAHASKLEEVKEKPSVDNV
ncbi:hypothetical protein C0991_005552, partial [Blastosporella zonata]